MASIEKTFYTFNKVLVEAVIQLPLSVNETTLTELKMGTILIFDRALNEYVVAIDTDFPAVTGKDAVASPVLAVCTEDVTITGTSTKVPGLKIGVVDKNYLQLDNLVEGDVLWHLEKNGIITN
jgi:phage baseplate assembly protein gpV